LGVGWSKSITDRKEIIKSLQKFLAERGYYEDTIDGIPGRNTKKAVLEFQNESGLEADGLIGPDTLKKMEEVGSAQASPSPPARNVRAMLSIETSENLASLSQYWEGVNNRVTLSKSPIGHAQLLDGLRYNKLPTWKQEIWRSLLPQVANALSEEEIRQVYEFYAQLEKVSTIKNRPDESRQRRNMDNEREMEKLIVALLANGNPLQS
jgi:peptidoglycan hydrolase-like protein with peptidoglycan-binding domain